MQYLDNIWLLVHESMNKQDYDNAFLVVFCAWGEAQSDGSREFLEQKGMST